MLACTATATPVVRDEILVRLGLPADTPQIIQGFARPNLTLRAAEVDGRRGCARRVDALLAEALARPGAGCGTAIVYAATRRETEAECARLRTAGWAAAAYHAGLDGPRRDAIQQAFAKVKLLRGEPDPRLERSGLAATPTFGNLREHPGPWLLRLLRRCVTTG